VLFAGVAPASRSGAGFRTPSSNIACLYEHSYIACDIVPASATWQASATDKVSVVVR
jgi:hypothetical protein